MDTRTTDILKKIKANIREIDPQAEAYIFGSRARGDAREDSDWDILILTDYPMTWTESTKFSDHLYDLELELEEAFSTFVCSKQEWEGKRRVTPFYESVKKEGVKL